MVIVLENMASSESDTRTSRDDSLRSPKFDVDDDSPEHSERKRPLDGDGDLSDRKKSHFTGGEFLFFSLLFPDVAVRLPHLLSWFCYFGRVSVSVEVLFVTCMLI